MYQASSQLYCNPKKCIHQAFIKCLQKIDKLLLCTHISINKKSTMNLIDFCKCPPKEITKDNILNYTNLDFSSTLWPKAGDYRSKNNMYVYPHIIKHICNNIIDIHTKPMNSDYCLISKAAYTAHTVYYSNNDKANIGTIIETNVEHIINSGYYLPKYEKPITMDNKDVLPINKFIKKYSGHQQYVRNLWIPNYESNNTINSYYPKNIIKYNYILILLLLIMKYKPNVLVKGGIPRLPNILIKHKIMLFIYS